MLLDGVLVGAEDGARYPVADPSTGERIAMLPHGSEADVDAAVTVARRAFDVTGWSSDLAQRTDCLRQLHAALVEEAPAIRALTVRAAGIPVSLLDGDWYDGAVAGLAALLERADTVELPAPGVTAVITPWTSPHQLLLDRVGRALLGGDTVVLKPGAETAWLACELGRLALERTDLPPGALNVVTTRDVDTAIALSADPRVDRVSFTGSAVVAERVRHQATGGGKRIDVTAGGPASRAVGDGDDLEAAVRDAAYQVALNAGQRCGVPSRLEVPAGRYDEAVEVAVDAMVELAPGDPGDPATVCGPVVSPVQRDRVRRYVALAVQEGGRIACGERLPDRERGWWVAPTVVAGLDPRARVATEEILGPVLVVVPG
jgi:aldehyde dehydrogenase (NAD+)